MAREFNFNSANNLSVGDIASIDLTGTSITLAFWAIFDTVSQHSIMSKSVGDTSGQYRFRISNLSILQFQLQENAVGFDQAAEASSPPTGSWQHCCAVRNGNGTNQHIVYRQGTSVATGTGIRSMVGTAQSLYLGSDGDTTDPHDGYLAECAIWNQGLSAAEVAALARGISPLHMRRQALVGYWPIFGNASPEPDWATGTANATVTGTLARVNHAPMSRAAR